ncbi:hypothetical protein Tco_1183484 [Tanacetum coccineum]
MSTLSFADTHNMVAFLKKPVECEGFEQIVNGDAQIHALIDGKRIVVSEATIRRDLHWLNDKGGSACCRRLVSLRCVNSRLMRPDSDTRSSVNETGAAEVLSGEDRESACVVSIAMLQLRPANVVEMLDVVKTVEIIRFVVLVKSLGSKALSWKPCQGDSLNLLDHRIHIKMEMEMPYSS